MIDDCLERNVTILKRDLNTNIGKDAINIRYGEMMDQHEQGHFNEYFQQFAKFCAFIKLVVDVMVFQHKIIHKPHEHHLTTQQKPYTIISVS